MISLDNNPTFLGIRFDKYLTFKNQIDYIFRSCNTRLNILKVLSHHSWHLNTDTLIQMYKSLVRSLIDYSLFIYPTLSNKNKRKIQFIQDCALRIIFKKKWDFDTDLLHDWSKIDKLETRSIQLLKKIFDQASNNENPLINDLFNEFDYFTKNFKNENIFTLLDYI